jgi:hypothetical protein
MATAIVPPRVVNVGRFDPLDGTVPSIVFVGEKGAIMFHCPASQVYRHAAHLIRQLQQAQQAAIAGWHRDATEAGHG